MDRSKKMILKNTNEEECKFIVRDASVFALIEQKKNIVGLTMTDRTELEIHDTYLDSVDLDLYQQKAGLRLRKEGNKFCSTFKKHIKNNKGFLNRNEIEEELLSSHFENALTELKSTHPYEVAIAFCNQKTLNPIVDLVNQRIKWRLVNSTSVYEMCLDAIQFNPLVPEQVDYEIELEYIQGDKELIKVASSILTIEFGLQKSKSSKYKQCLEAQSKLKK
jgi:inorganic triphosphatase YgiF